jgi:hypothetical protein
MNSDDLSAVLEQIGVKPKKLDKLLSQLSEMASAIGGDDDEAALFALHKASLVFGSVFLLTGGLTKYNQFLVAISKNPRVKELLGNVGILKSHFDVTNYDSKELTSFRYSDLVRFLLVSDNLITDGKRCYRLSPSTECAVVSEGSNTKQEIHAGQTFDGGFSVLVGKWASTRTVGKDGRRATFVAVDKDWEISIFLNPEETADAQKMALRVKKQVEALATKSSVAKSGPKDMTATDTITSQLVKLSEMHQAGVLTEEEWTAAKKKILG